MQITAKSEPNFMLNWRIALGLLVAFGFAGVALATVTVSLAMSGGLDPFMYVGYINNYGSMIGRFGKTYYAMRVAYIAPERIFSELFGPNIGYYAFRFSASDGK